MYRTYFGIEWFLSSRCDGWDSLRLHFFTILSYTKKYFVIFVASVKTFSTSSARACTLAHLICHLLYGWSFPCPYGRNFDWADCFIILWKSPWDIHSFGRIFNELKGGGGYKGADFFRLEGLKNRTAQFLARSPPLVLVRQHLFCLCFRQSFSWLGC